jgi:hypothetical protein
MNIWRLLSQSWTMTTVVVLLLERRKKQGEIDGRRKQSVFSISCVYYHMAKTTPIW